MREQYDNGEERHSETCAFPIVSDDPSIDGFILFADQKIGVAQRSIMHQPALTELEIVCRELIDLVSVSTTVSRTFCRRGLMPTPLFR